MDVGDDVPEVVTELLTDVVEVLVVGFEEVVADEEDLVNTFRRFEPPQGSFAFPEHAMLQSASLAGAPDVPMALSQSLRRPLRQLK